MRLKEFKTLKELRNYLSFKWKYFKFNKSNKLKQVNKRVKEMEKFYENNSSDQRITKFEKIIGKLRKLLNYEMDINYNGRDNNNDNFNNLLNNSDLTNE